jgi:uncharacterized membrane protein YfcA
MARGSSKILGVGLAAGFLAGMLGVGGGLVMSPALLLRGLDLRRATGTALAIVPAAAAVAVIAEYLSTPENHNPLLALAIAAGGPLGVWLGRLIDRNLSTRRLKMLFLALLLVTAVRSLGLFGEIPSHALAGLSNGNHSFMLLGGTVLGVLAGICSILFGVGGGIVVVPGLVFVVGGVGFHQATAISLMAMIPTSLLALKVAHRDGRVVGHLLPPLFLGALPTAATGVWLRNHWLEAQPLTMAFGAFLLFVSWRITAPKRPPSSSP